MTKEIIKRNKELNSVCEECKKENESVSQNLIMYGYKICESCRFQKLFFQFNLIQKFLISLLKQ